MEQLHSLSYFAPCLLPLSAGSRPKPTEGVRIFNSLSTMKGDGDFLFSSGYDFGYLVRNWNFRGHSGLSFGALPAKHLNSLSLSTSSCNLANHPDNYFLHNNTSSSSPLSLIHLQLWREHMRARMNVEAMSSDGRRFLEKKLEAGDHKFIGAIIDALKHDIHDLMVHQVANFVIRKLFEVCTEEQMSELLVMLLSSISKLVYVCSDSLGAQVVQTLLSNLKSWKQVLTVVFVFSQITVHLAKNPYGHTVIMHFLEHFHFQEYKLLIEALGKNSVDICTNKYGCSLIPKIIFYVDAVGDFSSWTFLTSTVARQAFPLNENKYGNHVIQYLVELGISDVTGAVIDSLLERFVSKN
ncbi:putative pumilio homolog 13 [Andrographis paniculata]|uniref:putative pumilio homolog 13 n=1 Tax=Andrographis paniculata TaxID=175694 RepID=UPI0021E8E7D1|nr:putative pumilio homolog 13 [Andrographis paniculata]